MIFWKYFQFSGIISNKKSGFFAAKETILQ